MEQETVETKTMQKKKMNKRFLLVLIVIFLFLISSYISYRGTYLEILEINQEYLNIFYQNIKYEYITKISIFIVVFTSVYITNKFIKKGLSEFFKEENKQMPKLPNKSIALIAAIISSLFFSGFILKKLMLFVNATGFGISDLAFNMDIGFYIFNKTFIEIMLNCFIYLMIGLTIYTAAYYIITFNICFEAVDRQTLKKSLFIKQLIFFVRLIVIGIVLSIFLGTYGVQTDEFLKLKDTDTTQIYGAGLADTTIKVWGYRIFAVVILISVFVAIRHFKKEESNKVLYSLSIIPIYLVLLFIVMTVFQLAYVNNNELDKQKIYIEENINKTKEAYNIKIDEIDVKSSGTITIEEVEENKEVLKNISLVNSDITLSTLSALQTSTGHYSYSKTIPTKYKILNEESLVYISPREILSSGRTYNNKTYEYTHGYGTIITSATSTDEKGNVKYIQKEFDGDDEKIEIKQPRIYFGLETNDAIITNTTNKKEFDYPITSTKNATNIYDGNAGLNIGFFDRLAVSVKQKDLRLAITKNSTNDAKILINRNIRQRAKTILPYLLYDEEPYLVISDNGRLIWVIDAYTVSNEYPYSQPITIEYENSKQKINYIRNSAKVLVDAYDGTINFYITDKTDPIIMAYNKAYEGLFKEEAEIPQDIAKHFVYPKYLYNIQAKVLEMYHNVSTDVLYRGDDIWELSSNLKPYYTMVKTVDLNNSDMGLVTTYTPQDKKNINAYLIGTTNGTKKKLTLYKFSSDSNVLGTTQLINQIEQDETISKEIESITLTGTKLLKDIVIVPIDGTLIYVQPIYQISLNEKNSVPVLKKVIVASGNKLAIGNTLEEALKTLLSEYAVKVEVPDTETIEGLIEAIIKANNNLTESNESSNWEQIGRDLNRLQQLINLLEKIKSNEDKTQDDQNIINVIDTNIIQSSDNLILHE